MRRFLALLALLGGCAGSVPQHDKVVYHLSEGLPQASNGLRNIGNHLEVNPNARIVVVSHARGVDFLMKDAKDANGNRYEDLVEQLKMRGVRFEVCEITLRSEEHTSELQSQSNLVCRLLLEKKKKNGTRRARPHTSTQ